jgi:putative oxidoreductase
MAKNRNRDTSGAGSDFARLILRSSIGGTMIAHGVKHARSLSGTARWFESIGFRNPELQARLSAVVEIGAGSALLAGFATPLGASAVVGTMTVAARTVHLPHGFFITDEGYEYVATIAAAAIALGALGAGRYSADAALGVHHRLSGRPGALITAGLGIIGAAAQLATYWSKPSHGARLEEVAAQSDAPR